MTLWIISYSDGKVRQLGFEPIFFDEYMLGMVSKMILLVNWR
jgi:hypothetical protein